MALKWGIAAAGKISNDFVSALEALPSSDHKVVAVAARSQASADNFAKTHHIPTSYEGYKKLAEDKNVDIVYVGVIHPYHYEVSKLMLENGKHVLCEKPFTMNEKQTRKLIEIARANKLFIMEAIWSRCFPVYRELRKILDSGLIGDTLIVSKQKNWAGRNTRSRRLFTSVSAICFSWFETTEYRGSGHLNEEGVDNSASAIITYEGSKTAVVTTSALTNLSTEGIIYGTKGTIKVPQMWCPTTLNVNGDIKEFPLLEGGGAANYPKSVGLAYEAIEARKCINEGKLESEQITHEETIQLAHLMDKMRQDIGVVFPADSESY
ncbi:hypothetical protein NQ318_005021 [Aromia moschata]|uniref:Trans-1,2-dihydrobenzene-1,2-diol dehydrogenase n=1 Tax=Aromia moschata TaxID=1265417 RepID=A0AAV8Y9B1_9CUCU|nr:hypothetical protein NQ318_005021 [Aromia moschata]